MANFNLTAKLTILNQVYGLDPVVKQINKSLKDAANVKVELGKVSTSSLRAFKTDLQGQLKALNFSVQVQPILKGITVFRAEVNDKLSKIKPKLTIGFKVDTASLNEKKGLITKSISAFSPKVNVGFTINNTSLKETQELAKSRIAKTKASIGVNLRLDNSATSKLRADIKSRASFTHTIKVGLSLDGRSITSLKAQLKNQLKAQNLEIKLKISNGDLENVAKMTTSVKALNDAMYALGGSTIRTTNLLKEFARTAKSISQAANQVNSATKRIQPTRTKTRAASNTTDEMPLSSLSAKTDVTPIVNSSKAVNAAMNSTSGFVRKLTHEYQALTKEAFEFGKLSGVLLKRFLGFSLASGGVIALTASIRNGIEEAILYQREMVRLGQTTGQTTASLKDIDKEVTRLSKTWGVNSRELIVVAKDLAQAGKSAAEVKVALEAISQASLAPSFKDMNSIVETSIALMNQFNIKTNDLGAALSIINTIAAQTAVEAEDLSVAIQKAGAIFAFSSKQGESAFQSFSKFLSLFAAVKDTTQESAETTANALKTIASRIQSFEFIDKMRESGVILTEFGENGKEQFIGVYEAIEKLNAALITTNKLGQMELSSGINTTKILTEIGGLREIGKAIPLISQVGKARKNKAAADAQYAEATRTDANGNRIGKPSIVADAEFAQEAVTIKLNRTKEAFLSLIREFGKSDEIQMISKQFLDLANTTIKLVDSLRPLLPLITALGGARLLASGAAYSYGTLKGFSTRNKLPNLISQNPGPRGLAKGGYVDAMVMPGELIFSPQDAKKNGLGKLRRFNEMGHADGIKGTPMRVPGVGNTDSVPMQLPVGSFVIKKRHAENPKKFAIGDEAVRLYRGIGTDSDHESGLDWYAKDKKLAALYAESRRNGKVIEKDIPRSYLTNLLEIGNDRQRVSPSSFANYVANRSKANNINERDVKDFIRFHENDTGHGKDRPVISYWADKEKKLVLKRFLSKMNFKGITMPESAFGSHIDTFALMDLDPKIPSRTILSGLNKHGLPEDQPFPKSHKAFKSHDEELAELRKEMYGYANGGSVQKFKDGDLSDRFSFHKTIPNDLREKLIAKLASFHNTFASAKMDVPHPRKITVGGIANDALDQISASGSYSPKTRDIDLHSLRSNKEILSTLQHELIHGADFNLGIQNNRNSRFAIDSRLSKPLLAESHNALNSPLQGSIGNLQDIVFSKNHLSLDQSQYLSKPHEIIAHTGQYMPVKKLPALFRGEIPNEEASKYFEQTLETLGYNIGKKKYAGGGQVEGMSEEEYEKMRKEYRKAGIPMPDFQSIGGKQTPEPKVDKVRQMLLNQLASIDNAKYDKYKEQILNRYDNLAATPQFTPKEAFKFVRGLSAYKLLMNNRMGSNPRLPSSKEDVGGTGDPLYAQVRDQFEPREKKETPYGSYTPNSGINIQGGSSLRDVLLSSPLHKEHYVSARKFLSTKKASSKDIRNFNNEFLLGVKQGVDPRQLHANLMRANLGRANRPIQSGSKRSPNLNAQTEAILASGSVINQARKNTPIDLGAVSPQTQTKNLGAQFGLTKDQSADVYGRFNDFRSQGLEDNHALSAARFTSSLSAQQLPQDRMAQATDFFLKQIKQKRSYEAAAELTNKRVELQGNVRSNPIVQSAKSQEALEKKILAEFDRAARQSGDATTSLSAGQNKVADYRSRFGSPVAPSVGRAEDRIKYKDVIKKLLLGPQEAQVRQLLRDLKPEQKGRFKNDLLTNVANGLNTTASFDRAYRGKGNNTAIRTLAVGFRPDANAGANRKAPLYSSFGNQSEEAKRPINLPKQIEQALEKEQSGIAPTGLASLFLSNPNASPERQREMRERFAPSFARQMGAQRVRNYELREQVRAANPEYGNGKIIGGTRGSSVSSEDLIAQKASEKAARQERNQSLEQEKIAQIQSNQLKKKELDQKSNASNKQIKGVSYKQKYQENKAQTKPVLLNALDNFQTTLRRPPTPEERNKFIKSFVNKFDGSNAVDAAKEAKNAVSSGNKPVDRTDRMKPSSQRKDSFPAQYKANLDKIQGPLNSLTNALNSTRKEVGGMSPENTKNFVRSFSKTMINGGNVSEATNKARMAIGLVSDNNASFGPDDKRALGSVRGGPYSRQANSVDAKKFQIKELKAVGTYLEQFGNNIKQTNIFTKVFTEKIKAGATKAEAMSASMAAIKEKDSRGKLSTFARAKIALGGEYQYTTKTRTLESDIVNDEGKVIRRRGETIGGNTRKRSTGFGGRVGGRSFGGQFGAAVGAVGSNPVALITAGSLISSSAGERSIGGGVLGGAFTGGGLGATVSGGNPYAIAGGTVLGAVNGGLAAAAAKRRGEADDALIRSSQSLQDSFLKLSETVGDLSDEEFKSRNEKAKKTREDSIQAEDKAKVGVLADLNGGTSFEQRVNSFSILDSIKQFLPFVSTVPKYRFNPAEKEANRAISDIVTERKNKGQTTAASDLDVITRAIKQNKDLSLVEDHLISYIEANHSDVATKVLEKQYQTDKTSPNANSDAYRKALLAEGTPLVQESIQTRQTNEHLLEQANNLIQAQISAYNESVIAVEAFARKIKSAADATTVFEADIDRRISNSTTQAAFVNPLNNVQANPAATDKALGFLKTNLGDGPQLKEFQDAISLQQTLKSDEFRSIIEKLKKAESAQVFDFEDGRTNGVLKGLSSSSTGDLRRLLKEDPEGKAFKNQDTERFLRIFEEKLRGKDFNSKDKASSREAIIDSAFDEASKVFGEKISIAAGILDDLVNNQSKYVSKMEALNNREIQAQTKRIEAQILAGQRSNDIAELSGKTLSTNQLAAPEENIIRELGGSLDPKKLADIIIKQQENISRATTQIDAAKPTAGTNESIISSERLKELVNERGEEQKALARTEQALDMLARSTTRLTSIQGELGKVEQRRQAQRNVLDKLTRATLPGGNAMDLNKAISGAFSLLNGNKRGLTAETFDSGKELLLSLAAAEGENATKNIEQLIYKQQAAIIAGDGAPKDLIDKLAIGLTKRGESTPEKLLITEYQKASNAQIAAMTAQGLVISKPIDELTKAIQKLADSIPGIKKVTEPQRGTLEPDDGGANPIPPVDAKRDGGFIKGAYKGNRDTELTKLVPGEFVVRRNVAQKNKGGLIAMNGGMDPMQAFAGGGIVRRLSDSPSNKLTGIDTYANNPAIDVEQAKIVEQARKAGLLPSKEQLNGVKLPGVAKNHRYKYMLDQGMISEDSLDSRKYNEELEGSITDLSLIRSGKNALLGISSQEDTFNQLSDDDLKATILRNRKMEQVKKARATDGPIADQMKRNMGIASGAKSQRESLQQAFKNDLARAPYRQWEFNFQNTKLQHKQDVEKWAEVKDDAERMGKVKKDIIDRYGLNRVQTPKPEASDTIQQLVRESAARAQKDLVDSKRLLDSRKGAIGPIKTVAPDPLDSIDFDRGEGKIAPGPKNAEILESINKEREENERRQRTNHHLGTAMGPVGVSNKNQEILDAVRSQSGTDTLNRFTKTGRFFPAASDFAQPVKGSKAAKAIEETFTTKPIQGGISIPTFDFSKKVNQRTENMGNGYNARKEAGIKKMADRKAFFDKMSVTDKRKWRGRNSGKGKYGQRAYDPNRRQRMIDQIKGFNTGGSVDNVMAAVTPGEFVVKKDVAQKHKSFLNHLNNGGKVQKFANGGEVKTNSGGGFGYQTSSSEKNSGAIDTSNMKLLAAALDKFDPSKLAGELSKLAERIEGFKDIKIVLEMAPIKMVHSGAVSVETSVLQGKFDELEKKIEAMVNRHIDPLTGETRGT